MGGTPLFAKVSSILRKLYHISASKAIITIHILPPFLDCSPPSASNAIAMPTPRSSRSAPVSPRSPSAADRNPGCIGAGNAPPFRAKAWSSGPGSRSLVRSGPALITVSREPRGAHIQPPYARWRSNGAGSCIDVGKHELRTMSPLTSML